MYQSMAFNVVEMRQSAEEGSCPSIGKTKIRFQKAEASVQEFWARNWFVTIPK
jgi:hypothetical protein